MPTSPDEWMDDQIEPYLDGMLTGPERVAFERWLAVEPRWAEELRLARRVRDGLHQVPAPGCPPDVTQGILDHVRGEAARLPAPDRPARRRARFRLWTRVMRPSLAMAVLAALVVVAAIVGRVQQPARAPDPEVTAALEEVQWTLAYLSSLGRGTGQTVRDEVLEDHVVLPMQDALDIIFNEPSNR